MKRFCACLLAAAWLLAGCGTQNQSAGVGGVLIGRVTKVDGGAVTLRIGSAGMAVPPSGAPGASQPPSGSPPVGDGAEPQGSLPEGTPQAVEGSSGEERTLSLPEGIAITTPSGQSASLADIAADTLLRVSCDAQGTPTRVEILNEPSASAVPDQPSVEGSAVYTLAEGSATRYKLNLSAGEDDQSGIIVTGGARLSLTDANIRTSGSASVAGESDFFGLNAGILAKSQAQLALADVSVATAGSGANAIFATGEGTAVELLDCTIQTTGDFARGLDATQGGSIVAQNVNISTQGDHCAALATDRGGGSLSVIGGSVATKGVGSPAIYSTGDISVADATLSAAGSEAAVVEGRNAVSLSNATLTGAKLRGVMLYQSFSGAAEEGAARFTMAGGSLSAQAGPLFYVTNTQAEISLTGVRLSGGDALLACAADQWGASGQNGGHATLVARDQVLQGDIRCDALSSATIVLKGSSTLTGAINGEATAAAISLTLDADSVWNVTGDSYLTALTDSAGSLSCIRDHGHTIYYDAANEANDWLNGQTVPLDGGGTLTPRP